MPSLVFFILALIIALIHIGVSKSFSNKARRYELLTLYFLVFVIGLNGILDFFAHTVYAVQTAESIGWPPNNPFQTEVAFADLSYGIAGIICLWLRERFWLAVIIISGIFLFSAGAGHVYQMIANNDGSVNNAGIVLYADLLTPIIGLILYYLYQKNSKDITPLIKN